MNRATRRGVAWSGIEAGCAGLLSIVSAFLVARLIGPEELGIGTAAVSVHVLLWVGVNALFGDALVQRAGVDDGVVSSALWASSGVGIAAAGVQAASGLALAAVLEDGRLLPMGLCLAAALPLVGAAGAVQGLLTRRRRYARLALRTLLGQAAGTMTGVLAALGGAGAWAPVLQQLVTSAAGACVLLLLGGFVPRLVWRGGDVMGLLRIGLPLTASTLVLHARYRLFALLVGGTAGALALGQMHVAFRLVDTVRDLSFTALWRLMLPRLAERQQDPAALLAAVDRLLRLSSIAMLPLCGAIALLLPSVVDLLLGSEWAASGSAAEPLVALMAVLVLSFPAGVALVAIGQAQYALYANLAAIGVMAVSVLAVQPETAQSAVLLWCGSQAVVLPYVLRCNARGLGVGPWRPMRAGVPVLVVTLVAVAVATLLPWVAGPPADSAQLAAVRLAVFAAALALGGGWLRRGRGRRPALATIGRSG